MDQGNRFAARLRAGLAAAGMNQAELARRGGVTRAYVGRLLAGSQAAPTPEVVAALADALALGAADRSRLFAAAGLLPPELAEVVDEPAVAQLLTTLAAAPTARRAGLTRLLTALLDALDAPGAA
jgi:transcriptional regulator with XRE-family HTH domain